MLNCAKTSAVLFFPLAIDFFMKMCLNTPMFRKLIKHIEKYPAPLIILAIIIFFIVTVGAVISLKAHGYLPIDAFTI